MIEANYDEVICPNCVTQFRAIPVNVQHQITALTKERDAYAAAADSMAASHKIERDALKDAARLALDVLDDLRGIRMNEVEYLSVLRATAALKAVL